MAKAKKSFDIEAYLKKSLTARAKSEKAAKAAARVAIPRLKLPARRVGSPVTHTASRPGKAIKVRLPTTRPSTAPQQRSPTLPKQRSPSIPNISSFPRHVGEKQPRTTTGHAPSTRTTPFQRPQSQSKKEKSSEKAAGQGIIILEGTQVHAPHTNKTAKGRTVLTDRYFDQVFLCYDAGIPVDSRGGRDDPMLGIHFHVYGGVYYPNSTRADWRAIIGSGSSGRWFNSWSERGNWKRL